MKQKISTGHNYAATKLLVGAPEKGVFFLCCVLSNTHTHTPATAAHIQIQVKVPFINYFCCCFAWRPKLTLKTRKGYTHHQRIYILLFLIQLDQWCFCCLLESKLKIDCDVATPPIPFPEQHSSYTMNSVLHTAVCRIILTRSLNSIIAWRVHQKEINKIMYKHTSMCESNLCCRFKVRTSKEQKN